MKTLMLTALAAGTMLAGAVATSAEAQAQDNKTCMVAGQERTWTADQPCPKGIAATLRSLQIQREVPDTGGETKTVTLRFDAFARMLERAGVTESMRDGTYTVFVPNNQALAKMSGEETMPSDSGDDESDMGAYLGRHVVVGAWERAPHNFNGNFEAISGDAVAFNWLGRNNYVNGRYNVSSASQIQKADILAANGVIHVIDRPFAK